MNNGKNQAPSSHNQDPNSEQNQDPKNKTRSPEVEKQLNRIKQKMGEVAIRSIEISDEAINQKAMEVAREKLEDGAEKEIGVFRLLFGVGRSFGTATSKEDREKFKKEAGGLILGIDKALQNTIRYSIGRGIVYNNLRKKARKEIYESGNVYFEEENSRRKLAMKELRGRIIGKDGEIKEESLLGKEKIDERKEGDEYYDRAKNLMKRYMMEVSNAKNKKELNSIFGKYELERAAIEKVFNKNDSLVGKLRNKKTGENLLRFGNMREVMENAKNLKNMKLGEEAIDAYLEENFSIKSVKAELGLNIKEHADIASQSAIMFGSFGVGVLAGMKFGIRATVGLIATAVGVGGLTGVLREKQKQAAMDKKKGYGEVKNDGRLLDLEETIAVFGKYVSTDKNGKMNMATLADEGRKELIEIVGKVKAYIELSKEKGERLFRTNDRSNLEKEIRQLMEAYNFSENYLTKTGWAGNNSEDQLKQNIKEIEEARKDVLDGKIVKKEVNGKEVDEKEVGLRERIEKDKRSKNIKLLRAGLIGGVFGGIAAATGAALRGYIDPMLNSFKFGSGSFVEESKMAILMGGALKNAKSNGGSVTEKIVDDGARYLEKQEIGVSAINKIKNLMGYSDDEIANISGSGDTQYSFWVNDVDGGKDLMVYRNGRYESLIANGSEAGMNMESNGKFTAEQFLAIKEKMNEIGFNKVEGLEYMEGPSVFSKKSMSVDEFLNSEKGKSLESIVREGWSQEGTIGDVKMAGGGYVIPVSKFGGGSIVGSRLFISINKESQDFGWYFDVVDGNVKIPADHPAASLFMAAENESVSFNGGFMELTRQEGGGQKILSTAIGNNSVKNITEHIEQEGPKIEMYKFMNEEGDSIVVKGIPKEDVRTIVSGEDWNNISSFKGYEGALKDYRSINLGNGEIIKTKIMEGGYNQNLDRYFSTEKVHPFASMDKLYDGILDLENPPSPTEMFARYLEGASVSPHQTVDLAYSMGMIEDMDLGQRNELVEALCCDDKAFDEFTQNVMDFVSGRMEGGSVKIIPIRDSNILSVFGYLKNNGLVRTGIGEIYKEQGFLIVAYDSKGNEIIDASRVLGSGDKGGIWAECQQMTNVSGGPKPKVPGPGGPEPKIPKPTEPRPIPERPVPGGPEPKIPKPTGPRPNIPKDDNPIPKDTPNYENYDDPSDGGGGYDNGDGTSIARKGSETNAEENVTKLGATEEAAPLEKTEVKTGVNYEEMEAIERPENVASASDQEFGVEEGARIKTDDNGRAVVDGVVDENTSTRYTEDTGIWEEGRKSDVPPAIDASDVANEVNTGTRTINSNTATETVIENQSNAGTDTGSYNSEVNAGGTSSGSDSDLSSGSQQTGDDNNLSEEELAKRLKELRGW